MSVCLSVCQSINQSINQSIYQPINQSIFTINRYKLVTQCLDESNAKLEDLQQMRILACVCKEQAYRATKKIMNSWTLNELDIVKPKS